MLQCWFAPVIFLDGTAVSCLLLVKHHDQRCRLPYQKPSSHPAVLSSCSLFATSRLFLSSRTTWASPENRRPGTDESKFTLSRRVIPAVLGRGKLSANISAKSMQTFHPTRFITNVPTLPKWTVYTWLLLIISFIVDGLQ